MSVPEDAKSNSRAVTLNEAIGALAQSDAATVAGGGGGTGATVEGSGLHRMLVETVRDYAIFALDAAGYNLSWNAGAERLKGYTAEEIIGRHFSTFYPAEDLA